MEETTLAAIQRLDLELNEANMDAAKQKEAISEEIKTFPVAREIENLEKELKAKKEALKLAIKTDGNVTRMMENLADTKEHIRDLRDILSAHLVLYNRETEASQVPLADNPNRARQVIITGRLGKEDAFQERMQFAGGGK